MQVLKYNEIDLKVKRRKKVNRCKMKRYNLDKILISTPNNSPIIMYLTNLSGISVYQNSMKPYFL